jgi:hypothetical protein
MLFLQISHMLIINMDTLLQTEYKTQNKKQKFQ